MKEQTGAKLDAWEVEQKMCMESNQRDKMNLLTEKNHRKTKCF
jgi:hypothetical protein